MSYQSEAILENNLISQLVDLGYESVKIYDGEYRVKSKQDTEFRQWATQRLKDYLVYFKFAA